MTRHTQTIIVGAGLTGLTAAAEIKRLDPGHRLLVLERSESAGGVIRSFSDEGYLAEYGPHGFLDNCVESRALLRHTGLDRECVKASLQTFVRYVCIDGRLVMIPQSPLKIIAAPLVSFKDKIRVLKELFIEPLDGEPTAAKWAAHRFGSALLPYVDAVFTGTYAGDFNELKIDAVMPGVRELERRYGSVLRGVIAKARQARRSREPGKKLEMPAMTSFPHGMERLVEVLAGNLDASELHLGCAVTGIEKQDRGWRVSCGDTTYTADNLFLAVGVNPSLSLLVRFASPPQTSIPEAWIATVVLGFRGATLPPGFGFLIPEQEKRFTLGTLFSSNMFPNRAPQGHVAVETLVGGRRHPERLEEDDATLCRRALEDLGSLTALSGEPVFTRVLRPSGGIPQLEQGYPALLAWRNALVRDMSGLYVCGFGWEGIGINDMVKSAMRAADNLVAGRPQFNPDGEVKKIYF